jgi:hypothetical protein
MAKRGRPKINLDFGMIEKLSKIGCTQQEIASFLDVSVDTLQRSERFCGIYKKNFDKGNISLRRKQLEVAEGGNVAMLIWLGKQRLSQRDKQDIAHEGDIKIKINLTDD